MFDWLKYNCSTENNDSKSIESDLKKYKFTRVIVTIVLVPLLAYNLHVRRENWWLGLVPVIPLIFVEVLCHFAIKALTKRYNEALLLERRQRERKQKERKEMYQMKLALNEEKEKVKQLQEALANEKTKQMNQEENIDDEQGKINE